MYTLAQSTYRHVLAHITCAASHHMLRQASVLYVTRTLGSSRLQRNRVGQASSSKHKRVASKASQHASFAEHVHCCKSSNGCYNSSMVPGHAAMQHIVRLALSAHLCSDDTPCSCRQYCHNTSIVQMQRLRLRHSLTPTRRSTITMWCNKNP